MTVSHRARLLACAALVAGGAPSRAIDAPDLRVVVDTPPPAGLPMVLEGEIGTALAPAGAAPVEPARLVVDGPGGRCDSQAVALESGEVRLAWRPAGPGAYRIREVGAGEVAPGTAVAPPLARIDGGAILIDNGALAVTHTARRAGGFPSAVTPAGASQPLGIEFADRVYEPAAGQFFLSADPNPEVRLTANGPLFATVEVAGGYLRAAAGRTVEHEARPRARYRFTYHRGSPLVRVEMVVTQAAAFAWKELHLLEMRATAATLGQGSATNAAAVRALGWAGGDPPLASNATHAGVTMRFDRWSVLRFANGTAGIVHPHTVAGDDCRARIYDGPGMLYAMGPWVAFGGPRVEFERYLYFGPRDAPDAALAALAADLDRMRPPVVEFPGIAEQAAVARAAAQARTAGLDRALALRRLDRAIADLAALRNVAASRAALEAPAPIATPGFAPSMIEGRQTAAGGTLLATEDLLLELDARGRLTSFYQVRPGAEWLAEPCAMFRFVVRDAAGAEHALTANETALESAVFTNGALKLAYAGPCPGTAAARARVTLTLRPDGPGVAWRAEGTVEGEGVACWRLDAPVLDGVGRAGGDDAGDRVFVPDGWGRLLPRPSDAHYQGRYPGGSATMQALGCTRDAATLGLIVRDGQAWTKDLVAAAGTDGRTVSLEVRHYPADMGVTRTCAWPYDVETVALAGDWFALAQRYRAWATRQAWCAGGANRGRPDTPDWFRSLVWWHHDGVRDGTKLTDTVARVRAAVPFPMALHWYNWHTIPFDNFYPDYFPANDYVPAVRAQMRAWDVPVMPYINGHLWDPQSGSYTNEGGVRWAMKKPDGTTYLEHYAGHDHTTACPFTAAWRDKMVAVTDRLFREVGVDAVYLDQIGAAAAQLCHDPSHGHPRGGGGHYVAGYVKLLEAVRANARQINPRAALTTEDTAEPYIGQLDGMLMCNRALPDSVPFFPAVYHDHVAQFGLYIHEPEIQAGVTFRSKEAMLFQFGGQLGWHGTAWSEGPAHRAKFEWLAKLAAFRQAGLAWLAYGEMLRPPAVTLRGSGGAVPAIPQEWIVYRHAVATAQPAVTASAWRAPDGRIAVFVVNVADEPLAVAVTAPVETAGREAAEVDASGRDAGPGLAVASGALALDLAPRSVRMMVWR